jgi:signal transduction histidine kinase/FixJ family two-component response regulator
MATSPSLNILIVEDEPAHAEAIRRACVGSRARIAGNLVEYRQAVTTEVPDIVLMDLNLPDGLALQELTVPAEDGPWPILVMTAHGDEQLAVAAMKAGALDYIVKSPEAFAGMLQTLERALREWRLRLEHRLVVAALHDSEKRYRNLYHQFRAIFEGVPEPLLLLKWDLLVEWANPAANRAFGRNRADLAGARCHELFKGRTTPCTPCPIQDCFATGESREVDFHTRDGRHWSLRALPIRTEHGEIRQVLLIGNDIGAKMRTQADAIRASQLAALGELAAGVAHEINNPINGVINYAQLLSNRLADNQNQDLAGRIIHEGERIASIVGGLLSFARPQQENRRSIPLAETLDDCLALAGAQLRRDGIAPRLDLPADLPPVSALKYQLQQVFLNLISNARYALNEKYPGTHPDKHLDISGTSRKIDGQQWVRLVFRDTGTGIPPEILERARNPFFTTKPPGQGTGLGLSISCGIIENHGGQLTLESVAGEHTTVVVELPAAEAGS